MTIYRTMLALAWAGAAGLATIPSAHAATMALSYEQTQAGGITGGGSVTALGAPSSNTYSNTFTAPQTSPIAGSPSPGFGFYDDFVFSITNATVNSISSTISLGDWMLGISDLEVRLYNAASNPTLPVIGAPNGGAISAWSTPINYAPGVTGTIAVIPQTVLQLGTYVLEVRGTSTGQSGGSYTGTLNVAPVPLPGALALMLGGLVGLFGGLARRRAH